jgi:hypothetical protein
MYTVVRQYSGPGASQLFDVLERQKDEVERLIRGVSGVVSYTLLRTSDGGISVTVCQEKAGADEVRARRRRLGQAKCASCLQPSSHL